MLVYLLQLRALLSNEDEMCECKEGNKLRRKQQREESSSSLLKLEPTIKIQHQAIAD
jgi:hypothetical protein